MSKYVCMLCYYYQTKGILTVVIKLDLLFTELLMHHGVVCTL